MTNKTKNLTGPSVSVLHDDDDPFAEEPSVTPEEMLRQAIRRVLADGVVSEQEKAEVQSLRRTLGIAADTASRLFAEEKASQSSTRPKGKFQQKDFPASRGVQAPPTTVCPKCGQHAMISPDGKRGRCGSCEHIFIIGQGATANLNLTSPSRVASSMSTSAFRSSASIRPPPACASADAVSTAATGKLFITRPGGFVDTINFWIGIKVVVNGQLIGKLMIGETVTVDLPTGNHNVTVTGAVLYSRSAVISISAGTASRYITGFAYGISGMTFRPE